MDELLIQQLEQIYSKIVYQRKLLKAKPNLPDYKS